MKIPSATLRVDKSKLSVIGHDFSDSKNVIDEYNENIFNLVSGMSSGWTGPDYDAFVDFFERYRASLNGIATMFERYSEKVKEIDEQTEALMTIVKNALGIGATVANSMYSLESTEEVGGITVAYSMLEKYPSAKDARRQAENIQTNLQADIDILQQEINSLKLNIDSLTYQLELTKDPAMIAYLKEAIGKLELQKEEVETGLGLYQKAKDKVDEQLKKRFWPWNADGDYVEATDWWGNDTDTTEKAAKELNALLEKLRPVTTIVESASVNGLYAMQGRDDYLAKNFYNGSSVNTTMMETALHMAEKSKDTKTMTINGIAVTAFNSKALINSAVENPYYQESGSYTFSQNDAYENYETYENTIDGYDSIFVPSGNDGEGEYMTYAQFVKRYGEKE